MATLTGKITDVTSSTPENISSITVKAPSVRIGSGTDVIVSSPATVDFNRATGDITISNLTGGLSWLYIEGDGWSDSIAFAVADGMTTLVEAVANASGVPGMADFVQLMQDLRSRIDQVAQGAVDAAAQDIIWDRGMLPHSIHPDDVEASLYGIDGGHPAVADLPINVGGILQTFYLSNSGSSRIQTLLARESGEFGLWARYHGSTGWLPFFELIPTQSGIAAMVTAALGPLQDSIRRGAGEVSLTAADANRMDKLDSGNYRVTSAFTEVLGMPTNVAGHLHVAWLAASGNTKIHTYTARENFEFRVWARYQGSSGLLDWVPIVGDELAQNHPRVAHAVLTEDNELLQETRWDGSTYFPRVYGGFVGSGFTRLDGELVKTETDMTRMAGWGSSTMAWLEDAFSTIADTIGAEYFQMGQGSESGDATAARLGSRPALVTFPNNQMPASGSSNITISNVLIHGNPMPFDVTVGGIAGRISLGDNGWIFDRSIPGSAITFEPDTPAVPVIGESLRDAFTVINIGKNSFVSRSGTVQELVDYVTGLTVEAYDHLTPISKRAFVLGHFINANYAPGSDMYLKVQGVNNALKQKFGPVYIDLHEFVTSSRIWTITGISPTSDDLAHQSRGQLPPSLQLDQAHLNMDGLSAVGVLVFEHMRKHRWA